MSSKMCSTRAAGRKVQVVPPSIAASMVDFFFYGKRYRASLPTMTALFLVLVTISAVVYTAAYFFPEAAQLTLQAFHLLGCIATICKIIWAVGANVVSRRFIWLVRNCSKAPSKAELPSAHSTPMEAVNKTSAVVTKASKASATSPCVSPVATDCTNDTLPCEDQGCRSLDVEVPSTPELPISTPPTSPRGTGTDTAVSTSAADTTSTASTGASPRAADGDGSVLSCASPRAADINGSVMSCKPSQSLIVEFEPSSEDFIAPVAASSMEPVDATMLPSTPFSGRCMFNIQFFNSFDSASSSSGSSLSSPASSSTAQQFKKTTTNVMNDFEWSSEEEQDDPEIPRSRLPVDFELCVVHDNDKTCQWGQDAPVHDTQSKINWRSTDNFFAIAYQPTSCALAGVASSDDVSDVDEKQHPYSPFDILASSSSFGSEDGHPSTPVDVPASPKNSTSSLVEDDSPSTAAAASVSAPAAKPAVAAAVKPAKQVKKTAAAASKPAAAAAKKVKRIPAAAAAAAAAAKQVKMAAAAAKPTAAAAKPAATAAKKPKQAPAPKASVPASGNRIQPSRAPDCHMKETLCFQGKKQAPKPKDDTKDAGTKPKWV